MPGYIDQCDKAYSMLVRLRAADDRGFVKCVTCGFCGHYSCFDNGHGVVRGNMATRYEDRNTGPQCRECNRNNGGLQDKFAEHVDALHGSGTWEELVRLGHSVCKRTKAEVNEMAAAFRKEIAQIRKQKGL